MTPLHTLLLLLVVTIWGFNFVVIKEGLQHFPPIFLCFARFLITSFPAVFFIKRPNVPLRSLLLYSSVTFVLQFSLLFFAMKSGITPGLASILLQIQAFFSILLAVVFMKETIYRIQIIACLVALAGVLLIAGHLNEEITPLGLLLVLGAALTWALGSIIAKTLGEKGGLPLVVWSSLFAWPSLLLISLCFERTDWIQGCIEHCNWQSGLSVFYIAYGSTLFGFGIWNRLLQKYPLSKLAPFTLLAPIVGMVSSAILSGELLQWWKIGAAILILSGLGLHLLGTLVLLPKKYAKPTEEL